MIKILRKFLGDKATRDLKAINPFVKQIHEAYKTISTLSNDELRAKTDEFKERIAQNVAEEEKEVAQIKESIENDSKLISMKRKSYIKHRQDQYPYLRENRRGIEADTS